MCQSIVCKVIMATAVAIRSRAKNFLHRKGWCVGKAETEGSPEFQREWHLPKDRNRSWVGISES